MPTVFNAANEVCVQAFLERRIAFLQIAEFVESAMMLAQLPSIPSKDHASRDTNDETMTRALEIDCEIRRLVGELFASARLSA
jgi:1-deoxy-D-xylulose-5-phosphate reductoisomerase